MKDSTLADVLAAQRDWDHWFSDGWPLIGVGLSLLLWALAVWRVAKLSNSRGGILFGLAMSGLLLETFLLPRWLKWCKARTTDRRGGHVAPTRIRARDIPWEPKVETLFGTADEPDAVKALRRRYRWGGNAEVLAAMMLSLVELFSPGPWLAWLAAPLAAAVVYGYSRRWHCLTWRSVLGVLCVGIAVAARGIRGTEGICLWLAGTGAVGVGDGALMMAAFLRRHPPARQVAA